MKLLLAGLMALGIGTAAMAGMEAPEGRVLITVGGDLPDGNAAGGTLDEPGLTSYLDLEYAKAVAFDDAMLVALPQHDIKATLLNNETAVTYSGPRLSDVLKASGAEGLTAMPMAFDGYQVEIPWDQIAEHEPILATHSDGAPMPIGKLGPAMIVFPETDDAELAATFEALQVYSLFYIGVE